MHLLNYWLKVAFNFFLIRTILYIERMNPWYCNWKVWLHYLLGFPAHSMLKAYYHTIIGHIQNTITAWNFILSSSWSKSTTIYPTDSTIKGFGKLFFCEIKDVSQWSHLCLLLLFCRDLDEDFFNTFSFISVQEWWDRLSKSIPVPSRSVPWQHCELVPMSLCSGTWKDFLSLCPEKLHCPVPLETI